MLEESICIAEEDCCPRKWRAVGYAYVAYRTARLLGKEAYVELEDKEREKFLLEQWNRWIGHPKVSAALSEAGIADGYPTKRLLECLLHSVTRQNVWDDVPSIVLPSLPPNVLTKEVEALKERVKDLEFTVKVLVEALGGQAGVASIYSRITRVEEAVAVQVGSPARLDANRGGPAPARKSPKGKEKAVVVEEVVTAPQEEVAGPAPADPPPSPPAGETHVGPRQGSLGDGVRPTDAVVGTAVRESRIVGVFNIRPQDGHSAVDRFTTKVPQGTPLKHVWTQRSRKGGWYLMAILANKRSVEALVRKKEGWAHPSWHVRQWEARSKAAAERIKKVKKRREKDRKESNKQAEKAVDRTEARPSALSTKQTPNIAQGRGREDQGTGPSWRDMFFWSEGKQQGGPWYPPRGFNSCHG